MIGRRFGACSMILLPLATDALLFVNISVSSSLETSCETAEKCISGSRVLEL